MTMETRERPAASVICCHNSITDRLRKQAKAKKFFHNKPLRNCFLKREENVGYLEPAEN